MKYTIVGYDKDNDVYEEYGNTYEDFESALDKAEELKMLMDRGELVRSNEEGIDWLEMYENYGEESEKLVWASYGTPEKIKAYKLVRLAKDGNVYPLFINRKEHFKIGEWMDAECHPTKGFAVRKGFHCCFEMNAPHLKKQLANGEERVWVECEVSDFTTYDRPESQGGKWILADKMRVLRIVG